MGGTITEALPMILLKRYKVYSCVTGPQNVLLRRLKEAIGVPMILLKHPIRSTEAQSVLLRRLKGATGASMILLKCAISIMSTGGQSVILRRIKDATGVPMILLKCAIRSTGAQSILLGCP